MIEKKKMSLLSYLNTPVILQKILSVCTFLMIDLC